MKKLKTLLVNPNTTMGRDVEQIYKIYQALF